MDGKDVIRNLIMTIAAEVRFLSSKASRGLAMCACVEGFACCGCTCVFKGAVGGTVNIGLFHPGNLYPFQSLDLLKILKFLTSVTRHVS